LAKTSPSAIWSDDGAYRLAVDTSTEVLTLALARGREIRGRRRADDSIGAQARLLLPFMKALMDDEGIGLPQLSGFVVSNGPGSFTGIRIGVATVRALAWALDIPVVAASTLDALAWNACTRKNEGAWVLPMLDARKAEVYAALYRVEGGRVRRIHAPGLFAPAGVAGLVASIEATGSDSTGTRGDRPLLLLGRGYRRYAELIDAVLLHESPRSIESEHDLPDAASLFWASELDPGDPSATYDPVYLRRTEAEVAWDAKQGGAGQGPR
jgi:tRNA threonylcarbamoyladenosine biosynthesis protein TsaB